MSFHPAEQIAHGLPGDLAQQVQDGELGRRHADPEGDPLIFIIVVMTIQFPEQGLKLAGVLPNEEWGDPVQEDRVGMDQVHGVGDRKALGAVGRPHAYEEVTTVA